MLIKFKNSTIHEFKAFKLHFEIYPTGNVGHVIETIVNSKCVQQTFFISSKEANLWFENSCN
jgi:hypothetical protein